MIWPAYVFKDGTKLPKHKQLYLIDIKLGPNQLLGYLSNDVLPTLNSCRSYTFRIDVGTSDKKHAAASAILSSLFQFDAIDRCNELKFICTGDSVLPPTALPIDRIVNWLIRPISSTKERTLFVSVDCVQNTLEIIERLRMVGNNLLN